MRKHLVESLLKSSCDGVCPISTYYRGPLDALAALVRWDDMAVLSGRELAFWEEHGYVVVPAAVPGEQLETLVEAIWDSLKWTRTDRRLVQVGSYDRNDPQTPISEAGMVSMYPTQAMWDNRQFPRVHQAFAQIFGSERLGYRWTE